MGVAAWGETLAEVLEQSTIGMATIAGVWRPGDGDEVPIDIEAGDPGALLVDWMSEVLYLHEVRRSALAGVIVEAAHEKGARGLVRLTPLTDEPPEGTQVKAVTYHRLEVGRDDGGWRARVYLDV